MVLGNGSNEVLELVAHAFLAPGTEAVMGVHGFAVYRLVTLLMGAKPVPRATASNAPFATRSVRSPTSVFFR